MSRAFWIALKMSVEERFAPEERQFLLQHKGGLAALREKHGRAETMADAKSQLRKRLPPTQLSVLVRSMFRCYE